jgi:hypothetical protein
MQSIWWEFESQDTYPTPGYNWARLFRNQEKRKNLRITEVLSSALKGADAVFFAVRHSEYLALKPEDVVRQIGKSASSSIASEFLMMLQSGSISSLVVR